MISNLGHRALIALLLTVLVACNFSSASAQIFGRKKDETQTPKPQQHPAGIPLAVLESAKAVFSLQKGNAFLGGAEQGSAYFISPSVAVTAYHVAPTYIKKVSFGGKTAAMYSATGPDDPLANPLNLSRANKQFLKYRSDMDLTVLDFGAPVSKYWLPLAVKMLEPGEEIYLIGTPGGVIRREVVWQARYDGMYDVQGEPTGLLKATVKGKEGVSGGTVVNKHGESVGTFSHMDPTTGTALFTPAPNLMLYLRDKLPNIFQQVQVVGVYPYNLTLLEVAQREKQKARQEQGMAEEKAAEEVYVDDNAASGAPSATKKLSPEEMTKLEIDEPEVNLWELHAGKPKELIEIVRARQESMNESMIGLSANQSYYLTSDQGWYMASRGTYRITVSAADTDSKTGKPLIKYQKRDPKSNKISKRETFGVEVSKFQNTNTPDGEYRGELLDPVINQQASLVPAGSIKSVSGETLYRFLFGGPAATKSCLFSSVDYSGGFGFKPARFNDFVDCQGEVHLDSQLRPRYVKRVFFNIPNVKGANFVSGSVSEVWYEWQTLELGNGKLGKILLPKKSIGSALFRNGHHYGFVEEYENWFTSEAKRAEELAKGRKVDIPVTNVKVGSTYQQVDKDGKPIGKVESLHDNPKPSQTPKPKK